MDPNFVTNSASVEVIYHNIKRRLTGILTALTSEVEEFYNQCDPEKENMCLYGLSNGRWKVGLPAEDVPAELPEPALGINFARDGMLRKDWLTLIALHSDAWLLALSSFYGAELNRTERKRLLMMLSDLPKAYDIITGRDVDEDISSVDQISNTNNFREGSHDEGKGTSSQFIHIPGSDATIPEQMRAEMNTASTSERGNKEACTDSSVKQVAQELSKPLSTPTTPLKRREPQTCPRPQEIEKHMQQVQVTTPSKPCRVELASPVEMYAQSKQESEGQSAKKTYCTYNTALIGPAPAHPLEVTRTVQTPAPTKTTKQAEAKSAQSLPDAHEIYEDTSDEDDDTLCGSCQMHNTGDDIVTFWIACDCCEQWFHGKCVKITPAKAEYMKHFKCPQCTSKRALLQVF